MQDNPNIVNILRHLKRNRVDEVLEPSLGPNNASNSTQMQLYQCLLEEENSMEDPYSSELECVLNCRRVKPPFSGENNNMPIPQLERTCSGKYECRSKEVTQEQLNSVRLKLPRLPKPLTPEKRSLSQSQAAMANFFLRSKREPPVQEVSPIGYSNASQPCGFRTAREELILQNIKKYGQSSSASQNNNSCQNVPGKTLGLRRKVHANFVCPVREEEKATQPVEELPIQDERLAHIDPKMVEMIESEIMRKQEVVSWDDIAGLEYAKSVIEEIVIAALLRPDLYRGLRRPPRGVLLFGPPGTGKTLIGRCIASQSKSTFFSISASSITSKYVGESEKMVRALFAVAAVHQPSVIFIDEIDSMLCKRNEGEQEFTRRLKNEFLVQLDGTTTSEDDRIVVVGATNRPQELDEAARRRLVRRLYIPLPDLAARLQMIESLLKKVKNDLLKSDVEDIGKLTDGYSCADLKNLLHEASLKPLRGIPYTELISYSEDRVRPVNKADICASLRTVRPTVAKADLTPYLEWNRLYGTVREEDI